MLDNYVAQKEIHQIWNYCSFYTIFDVGETSDQLISTAKENDNLISENFLEKFEIDRIQSQEFLTDEFLNRFTKQMSRYFIPYKDFRGNIEWEEHNKYSSRGEDLKDICIWQVKKGFMELKCHQQKWVEWNNQFLVYEFNHYFLPTEIINIFYNVEIMLLNSKHWICYSYYSDNVSKRGEEWFNKMLASVFSLIKHHSPTINKDIVFI